MLGELDRPAGSSRTTPQNRRGFGVLSCMARLYCASWQNQAISLIDPSERKGDVSTPIRTLWYSRDAGRDNDEEANPQQRKDREKRSCQCEYVHDHCRVPFTIDSLSRLVIRDEEDNPQKNSNDHEGDREMRRGRGLVLVLTNADHKEATDDPEPTDPP